MNRFKNEIIKTSIVASALLFAGGQQALAGNLNESQRAKLKEISMKMAAAENDRFVVVEAMSDGLIQDGSAYSLVYTSNFVSIDGKQLQEPMQSKYVQLLSKYFKIKHEKGNVTFFQISDDAIWVNNVVNDAAKSPAGEQSKLVVLAKSAKDYTPVVTELAKDKQPNAPQKTTISYNGNDVFINGKQLPATEEKKYKEMLFNMYGIQPTEGGTVIINK